MKKKSFILLTCVLLLFRTASSFADRMPEKKPAGYIGAMRVVWCDEWVSLRAEPKKPISVRSAPELQFRARPVKLVFRTRARSILTKRTPHFYYHNPLRNSASLESLIFSSLSRRRTETISSSASFGPTIKMAGIFISVARLIFLPRESEDSSMV